MEDKFGRLFYLNNYSKYSNKIINDNLITHIDYVLRNDIYNINKYLNNLRDTFNNINCYMYVLESISNYLVRLNNYLFVDYMSHDKYAYNTLKGIKSKYDCVLGIYDFYLNRENEKKDNDKVIRYDFSKNNKFGVKRKIYTNNLKKRTR